MVAGATRQGVGNAVLWHAVSRHPLVSRWQCGWWRLVINQSLAVSMGLGDIGQRAALHLMKHAECLPNRQ